MRIIRYIVVHCSGNSGDIKIKDIQNYWKKELKWTRPGYHYIIERDGNVVKLENEHYLTNGAKGYNEVSIHVCYIGGIDKKGNPCDNKTRSQEDALFDLLVRLTEKYKGAEIVGHRDLPGVTKACPSFDVKEWLRNYTPDLDKPFAA